MATIPARPLTAPSDFGNTPSATAAADGEDIAFTCPRAMTVTDVLWDCDNNPTTTTVTVTFTANGVTKGTLQIAATTGALTKTSFPFNLAAGDKVRSSNTNTGSNGTLTHFSVMCVATAI